MTEVGRKLDWGTRKGWGSNETWARLARLREEMALWGQVWPRQQENLGGSYKERGGKEWAEGLGPRARL